MKPVLFFIICLMCFAACVQNESEIPEAAKNKLAELYPEMVNAEWKVEGKIQYEADFYIDSAKTSVILDGDGNVLTIEKEISAEELPDSVKASLIEKFGDLEITMAELITEGSETSYEITLYDGKSQIEAYYSSDGTLIKYSVEEDDWEDDGWKDDEGEDDDDGEDHDGEDDDN